MKRPFIIWDKVTPEEETEYRAWARDHYQIGDDINGRWHPVIQDECVKMNYSRINIGLSIEQQDIGYLEKLNGLES